MKVSDYIAEFIASKGVKQVFVLTGGCILHCIDSISKNKDIDYIPVQNEQAGAMCADAYSRVTGNIGVTMATSGPGATNLITGVCCSYYDSIPVIVITGQVPSGQLKRNSKSRQIGFQETDVISIFKPITKYAVLIDDPLKIKYELEKAYYIAKEGRPGPVILDICDDVQRAEINLEELDCFEAGVLKEKNITPIVQDNINKIISFISSSKRPVFVVGAAVRLAGISNQVQDFINLINIPFTSTWGAIDTITQESDYYVGGFGVAGSRAGNFCIQNADLVIGFGTRMDTHVAGSNLKNFARAAKKIVIDIDGAELDKYADKGMNVDLLIEGDVKDWINYLKDNIKNKWIDTENWINYINSMKIKYPICLQEYREQDKLINPYVFIDELSNICKDNAIIVTDCGSNLIWTLQGFKLKKGQRIITSFNHSPMGYSLPGIIGTYFAAKDCQNICIIGDGGMQINIQELATIHKYNIKAKIFIMNNHGHGIIQGTQDNWLESRYSASNSSDGGLPDPDFKKISEAYGIKAIEINDKNSLINDLNFVINYDGPIVCVIHMKQGAQIYPKLLIGRPLEDMSPILPRKEFSENMLIPALSN
jgi:acetolactate synthase-1/2/3 large subunit